MADESGSFNKTRRNSVEDAFNSEESDWSDYDADKPSKPVEVIKKPPKLAEVNNKPARPAEVKPVIQWSDKDDDDDDDDNRTKAATVDDKPVKQAEPKPVLVDWSDEDEENPAQSEPVNGKPPKLAEVKTIVDWSDEDDKSLIQPAEIATIAAPLPVPLAFSAELGPTKALQKSETFSIPSSPSKPPQQNLPQSSSSPKPLPRSSLQYQPLSLAEVTDGSGLSVLGNPPLSLQERERSIASIPSVFTVKGDDEDKPKKDSKAGKNGSGDSQEIPSKGSKKEILPKKTETLFKRKSSEPTPISTLLLDTPIKSISSDSRAGKGFLLPDPPNRSFQGTPTRATSAGEEDDDDNQTLKYAASLPSEMGSAKRISWMGKIKRTLGMRKTRSSKSSGKMVIPAGPMTTSEPNFMSSGDRFDRESIPDGGSEDGKLDDNLITIRTGGKTQEEVLIELLGQIKTFVEEQAEGDGPRLKKSFTRISLATSGTSIGTASKASSETSFPDVVGDDVDRTGSQLKLSDDKMSYYCSQARPCEPNREIVYTMLDDIRCVIDKSYGLSDRINGDCNQLFNQCEQLREELTCHETTKAEQERQIQEMNHNLQQLQFCVDEQSQARENCEVIIRDMRGQVDRQDDTLNNVTAEKAELASRVRNLEVDLQNLRNQAFDLDTERGELAKQLAGYETCKARNLELQNALKECCMKCDEVQLELLEWKKKAHELSLQLETCGFEKCKLQNELDFERQRCADEKEQMEAQICQLANGVASLEKSKQEICQKMNEILQAHHEEMDNLKTDSDNYKTQLDDCRKSREELERKLRECEERKQQSNQAQQSDAYGQLQAELNRTKDELNRVQGLHEAEKKARFQTEQKLQDADNNKRQSLQDQKEEFQKVQVEQARQSQLKIDTLQNELEKAKFMQEQEKKNRESVEGRLRDTEDQKRVSTHEFQLNQEKKEFDSHQKLEKMKMDLDKIKGLYDDERRLREDAEKKLKDVDDMRNKNVHDQQVTVQLQLQQQEMLSTEKLNILKTEMEKYKTLLDIEKKYREGLEYKLRDLEDQNAKTRKEHHHNLQQHQQQQEFYTMQKLDLIKVELDKYKLMFEEEKRIREDAERRLRESEDQKQKNMLDHQEAFRKQQEYYTQVATQAQQQTDDERVARELWQRELRDAQRLWESEVKAKGILAEKLAKFEKQQNAVDAHVKRDQEEMERYKDKVRFLKGSLKAEKDLVIKVTNKLEEARHLAKIYKAQLEEVTQDSKVENLLGVIDNLKLEYGGHAETARIEKEKLMEEIYRLDQAKWKAERDAKKMSEDIKILEAEMSTWKNLAKMKDRIELEFIELKRAINDQFMDKRDVEKLKKAYEGKIADIKTHFEQEAQVKVNESLSQIARQTRDRQFIEKIRDVNENTLRTELTTMTKAMQLDIDRLKAIIRERDEQIVSLRKSLDIVKEKYADESRHRESLMKKLQILSSHNLETVPISQLQIPLVPTIIEATNDSYSNKSVGLK